MRILVYAGIFLISLVSAILATKYINRKVRELGRKGETAWDQGFLVPDFADIRKRKAVRIGGLGLVAGFNMGILFAIAFTPQSYLIEIFAALATVMLIALMGFFTDLFKVRQITRVIFPAVAALPLIAISAGVSRMSFPLVGPVELGIWYSLIIVPVGIMACSNLFNLLAGHNGLEAGTVMVAALALLIAVWLRHPENITSITLLIGLIGACLGFLVLNWYPAKVFPGDIGTYSMAAIFFAATVLSDMESIAIIAVMPQIMEFLMKGFSKWKAQNFGKPDKKGRLHYDGKIYSWTHIFMKAFKPKEWQLTLMLMGTQMVFGAIAIFISIM